MTNPTHSRTASGGWHSPITPALLTAATRSLSETSLAHGTVYWLESRPEEKGRTTVMRLDPDTGEAQSLLPAPCSARSRVNEYGGGSYCIVDDNLFFVEQSDQRIYRLPLGNQETPNPQPLTPADNRRYGGLVADPTHRRILAICEDHRNPEREAVTILVAIAADGGDIREPRTLASGADFYACPAPSPDGRQLAWLCWNHPDMPWDAAECWLADLDAGGHPQNPRCIAGGHISGEKAESTAQPRWSPGNELVLVSDRSNWWNLYRYQPDSAKPLRPLMAMDAEFAGPQWVFGQSSYCFLDAYQLLCSYTREGRWYLARLDLDSGTLESLAPELSELGYLQAASGRAVLIGANPSSFDNLYCYDPGQGLQALTPAAPLPVDPGYLSSPWAISFPLSSPSTGPDEGAGQGYGFYYPPTNPQYQLAEDEAPPLLVFCHGGPTSATRSSLNLKIQYWTSRGFAVADVNYGGSTGYGRRYRDRLKGGWGQVDVADVIDCVDWLTQNNLADPERLAIRGSSAGGYTVLAALTFRKHFRAGTSLYGIGNLETLAQDTHKFESRYMDQLVGPYPQARDIYQQRSPINHVAQLNCPVLFLQGMEDKVVPPNQAQAMVKALTKKSIPVACIYFDDEGHGFRQADNIQRAQEAELYFYSRVFGFELPEPVTPVDIDNSQHLQPHLQQHSKHKS